MTWEYSRIFLKVILASKQPSKVNFWTSKVHFGTSKLIFGCFKSIFWTSMPPMHQNYSIFWTSMPPMHQNYSIFWTSGTATTAAAAAAVSQELWNLGGALVQRAQEQNIPCGESLTSICAKWDRQTYP